MSNLYWLSDAQMERLKPFFPKSHGKPRVDFKGAPVSACAGKAHKSHLLPQEILDRLDRVKTIDKLIACLNKNGIKKIALNDPFKGGDITKTVHEQAGIPCLQLEINQNFRNLRKINNLKKLCKALGEFVKTAF